MHVPRLALVGTLAAALSSPVAWAAPKQFLANLNGGQETPPVNTTAFGVAHLTLDQSTNQLCFSITFTGLSSAETAAHIHGPAEPGVPAGILVALPTGNPKNGCVGPLDKTTVKHLIKNLTYVNIHSTSFTGGEIRGQILRIK